MSKVVKGVGRAVGKVVEGVKKVAKSKLGKAILIAAAVYFGGAALMGGLNASAAGGSFISGMGSGLSSAATGISNAFSAIASGNLSGAGTALSQGFTGTAGTAAAQGASAAAQGAAAAGQGFGAAGGTAAQMGVPVANAAQLAPGVGSSIGSGSVLSGTAASPYALTASPTAASFVGQAAGSGAAANTGIISKMMASQYAAPALISTGGQLIGGAMQGYGAQKQYEEQKKLAADERARYNTNIGTRLWGG